MGFSADSKLGEIVNHPVAYAVLAKHFPEVKTAGAMVKLAHGMTLNAISRFPQAKMSPEKLRALVAELQEI